MTAPQESGAWRWEPVGIDWCRTHHGVRNEDETACDLCAVDDAPCELVQLGHWAPQRPVAGDGLDREAVRRRAEAARVLRIHVWGPPLDQPADGPSLTVQQADAVLALRDTAADVPALLDALEAAEADAARWKRIAVEMMWHGEYTMGRWAPEVRHADPCDCDEENEEAGEACMDNSEWTFAVFAAGGAFGERLIVALPRTPPEPDDDYTEPAFVLRTEGGASCDHVWHAEPDTHCAKGCGASMPEGGAS